MKAYAEKSEYGNYLAIKHDDGKISVLAHLEKFTEGIEVGDEVKQGDVIATAGGTGTIKGMAPHLHWSVFDGVDKLIDKDGDDGIFIGPNWVVNKAKSMNPQNLVDSGKYIHPSLGEITSEWGDRSSRFPNSPRSFHEGMDYSLRTRRKKKE